MAPDESLEGFKGRDVCLDGEQMRALLGGLLFLAHGAQWGADVTGEVSIDPEAALVRSRYRTGRCCHGHARQAGFVAQSSILTVAANARRGAAPLTCCRPMTCPLHASPGVEGPRKDDERCHKDRMDIPARLGPPAPRAPPPSVLAHAPGWLVRRGPPWPVRHHQAALRRGREAGRRRHRGRVARVRRTPRARPCGK